MLPPGTYAGKVVAITSGLVMAFRKECSRLGAMIATLSRREMSIGCVA
jgi:hypothetical protein